LDDKATALKESPSVDDVTAAASVPDKSEAPPVGEVPPTERSSQEKAAKDHPIAKAVSGFVYKLRDFEDCVVQFVPVAQKMRIDSLKSVAEEALALVKSIQMERLNPGSQVRLLKRALEFMPILKRVVHANPGRSLGESLFIGMFSALDAFTGDLLRALFERKPALFSALHRQVDVVSIMESKTLEDLKRTLVEDEIEAFRRESYDGQFAKLETLFDLRLRRFPRWGEFIERSQRRNLLTHCDGRVTDQYLEACRSAGVPSAETIGARLDVSLKYLKATVGLLMEIGIKLGQTLWRKVLPDELEVADISLNSEIYDRLRDENWDRAMVLAEFAIEQPRFASDAMRKIFTVNYIIAAKFGGQPEKASDGLASLDWSGAMAEFKLAKAVLEDRFEDACAIMLRIGKGGEFFKEHTYHVFPLFRVFRLQECFLTTYEKVFGRPFSEEVQKTLDQAENQLKVEVSASVIAGGDTKAPVPP
jgi:hypothetical protein